VEGLAVFGVVGAESPSVVFLNFRTLGSRFARGALLVLPGVIGHCVCCRPKVLRFLTGEVLISSDLLIRMGTFCPCAASLAMAATMAGSEPLGALTRILTFCFPSEDDAGGGAKPASLAAFRAATLAL